MKLLTLALLSPLLLCSCVKEEDEKSPDAQPQTVRYYDGTVRISEFVNMFSATGTIDTTYRLDTSWSASVAITTDTVTGSISFSLSVPTMFPVRGGTSISPTLPAGIDSTTFRAIPEITTDGYYARLYASGPRQVSVTAFAAGDSLSFIDFAGDFGQRRYRIEHRFDGKLRR